jgi:WD40 repeat protein
VSSVAFSRDGATLATAGYDGTILLWDAASGQPQGAPLAGPAGGVWSVAFSPDGETLAAAGCGRPFEGGPCLGEAVLLWDVADGRPRGAPLAGPAGGVWSVAFSPDGATLAAGGGDGEVVLWDVAAGRPSGELPAGVDGAVTDVAFSPNSARLALTTGDGTVVLWDADLESWKNLACRRANRNLTAAEWRLFIGEDVPDEPHEWTCPELPPGEGALPATPIASLPYRFGSTMSNRSSGPGTVATS